MKLKRLLMLDAAWIACALGFVGVFVPVLPTTPLLLLATFLFAKSSPRCQAWIEGTRVYRSYVVPFKESGGIEPAKKMRILLISYALMGLSAALVRKPVVWVILSCAALFLAWLVLVRIPTVRPVATEARAAELAEAE